MRLRQHPVQIVLIALIAGILIADRATQACAPAPRPNASVHIAEESAIIVWDPQKRIQHFIRRATFDTDTPDFGFLVPTPTQPVLAEARDGAFDRLAEVIKPPTVFEERKVIDWTPLIFGLFLLGNQSTDRMVTARPPVRVLESKSVAGYDAVVLEADNPDALAEWLISHDYAITPELTQWSAPYIAARWKITAFKIAKGQGASRVTSSAVRMSFATDRPFFPYREPSDQRDSKAAAYQSSRRLSVFMLSAARMEGVIGESSNWPGRPVWAYKVDDGDRGDLARELALEPDQLPAPMWLTAFVDTSSPRPGTDDLYFAASKDQSSILPPPVVRTLDSRIPVPIDVVIFLLLAVGAIIAIMRRRRSEKARAAGAQYISVLRNGPPSYKCRETASLHCVTRQSAS